ncbi:MAG: bifunctional diguanylate cyclase/phosphodiesterase [Roseburia sp.]|nr:bifunctional diguanylate cyclase/phosphodiesterase [Roseburia sp.]MCM1280097.1 bifunctional diguanylate cyclase/phosphodiesterase [Robinsoniella sp.]
MKEEQYQMDLLLAMNKKLAGNERMYRMICGMSSNAFIYYHFQEKRIEVLGCFEKFFSFQVHSLADLSYLVENVKDEFQAPLREIIFDEKNGVEYGECECRLLDGKTWLKFEVNITYDEEKAPLEKVIRIKDISKLKMQNEELLYMAYYDTITGLYNRNYFVRMLSEWLRKAEEEQVVVSVLCIDIDDFKKVNDGLGMIAGDELIQGFGMFLKSEFKNENTLIAHVNDDLFYMAIYDPVGQRSVESIYDTIREKLKAPFVLSSTLSLKITICVGVAEYPEASRNSLELMNCAEIVMFKAKSVGKDNIQYFEAPILTNFKETIQLENKLENALNGNEFELYYQPQYDSKTKKLRGVEALIRWRDDLGKMISPGVFIPIAEQSGMIVPIGTWVLEEGISRFAKWKEKYDMPLVISLNISAIQYKRPDFVYNLLNILKKYQVNPSEIELEITESVLIDDFESVLEKLHVLKEYGIKISLDDFGTGFSSLSYLKGLPIDTLKIDKSFIDTVICDDSTRVITESIVSMVKKLGCETVAEGVETEEQYEYLKDIDCDNIQGFFLGRPMPAAEIEKIIAGSFK